MLIGQAQVVRQDVVDRNMLAPTISGSVVASPHAQTTRVTYTVPVGKKFHLSLISVSAYRNGLATALGRAVIFPTVEDSGGVDHFNQLLNIYTVAVGFETFRDYPFDVVLDEGTVIRIDTNDGSTGGSIIYNWSIVGNEYDA